MKYIFLEVEVSADVPIVVFTFKKECYALIHHTWEKPHKSSMSYLNAYFLYPYLYINYNKGLNESVSYNNLK